MALYNKYRPSKLDEVIGQKDAISLIKAEIVSPRSSYLFVGKSGSGKTTLARIFAEEVNAEVIEIDAASNNGVDNIRSLRDLATYVPAFYDRRMFIIDECHMLSNQAWNALLKILEESPPTTIWVLATTEEHKVIETVVSRCTKVRFNAPSVDQITDLLNDISIKEGSDTNASRTIATACDGNVRMAIGMLEDYIKTGELNINRLSETDLLLFMKAIYSKDVEFINNYLTKFTSSDILRFAKLLTDYQTMLVVRNSVPLTVKTEEILANYTNISVDKLDMLRDVQLEISQYIKDDYKDTLHLLQILINRILEFHVTIGELFTFQNAIYGYFEVL